MLGIFPAVAVLGPRQCGKTTLAKQLGGVYFDMETQGSQARLDAEWETLTNGDKLIVIDEAQQAPWVFSRLRGTIDAQRKTNGRFLLTGSVSPALMKNVSESLAGRIALVYMTPLLLPELNAGQIDELWLNGGYPDGGILNAGLFPQWQQSYLEMMTTRDLPNWGLPAKPQQTMRLLAMLAVSHGQAFNASGLGASLSLDHKTVQSYCDFLEGVFLIRRLAPYHANITKRLIKTPKIYWRDSGLLHSLLNVNNMNQLYNQPWLGHSWEGFIVEQTLSTITAAGKRATPYFFRTGDGYELDIVLDWGAELWAIEIKLTSDPSTEMISKLHKTADMINASKRILICRIAEKIENQNLLVANPAEWMKTLLA